MGHIFEPMFHWRIVLVGWGTVVLTTIMMVFSIGEWQFLWSDFVNLEFYVGIFHCMWIGTAVSAVLLIPMLIIWMPIYANVRRYVGTVRKASIFAAFFTAAAGMINIGLIFEMRAGQLGGFLMIFLPWIPFTSCIAAGLTWFAFRSEQFEVTQ